MRSVQPIHCKFGATTFSLENRWKRELAGDRAVPKRTPVCMPARPAVQIARFPSGLPRWISWSRGSCASLGESSRSHAFVPEQEIDSQQLRCSRHGPSRLPEQGLAVFVGRLSSNQAFRPAREARLAFAVVSSRGEKHASRPRKMPETQMLESVRLQWPQHSWKCRKNVSVFFERALRHRCSGHRYGNQPAASTQ